MRWLNIQGFADEKVLYLTTIGRRTGLPREVEIWFVGKCTPRLERAGVLEKLKFDTQARGSQLEIHRIDLYDRSPPDMGSDQALSLCDVVSANDAVGLDIHAELLPSRLRKVSSP